MRFFIGNEYHSHMRRLIGKALVAVVGLVAVAVVAAYLYARQSLPAIDAQ
jgi:hypothetical protein